MQAILRTGLVVCLAALAIGLAACGRPDPEIPRISVAAAFTQHGDPHTVFVDVRTDRTWLTSAQKIAGAVREDPNAVEQWAGRYDPQTTFVCYCT